MFGISNERLEMNLNGLIKSGEFIDAQKDKLLELLGDKSNNKIYESILKKLILDLNIEVFDLDIPIKNLKFILGNFKDVDIPILKKMSNIIFHGKLESIKSFFGENSIVSNSNQLEIFIKFKYFDICNLFITDGKPENIELFFGKSGIIRNHRELNNITNHKEWDNISDLILRGKNLNILLENIINVDKKSDGDYSNTSLKKFRELIINKEEWENILNLSKINNLSIKN